MHAYLLVGQGIANYQPAITTLAKKLKAKIIELALTKIEEVRALTKFTALKLDQPTAIVIKNIDQATEEAQNAFLKNLEEPQEYLYYILTTNRLAAVLPTIVSRCQIIKIHNSQFTIYNENSGKFLKMTIGEKLAFCDKIKDRGEARQFVNDLINILHQQLLSQKDLLKTARNLEICIKTLNNLEANGNLALQLSNLVINFT